MVPPLTTTTLPPPFVTCPHLTSHLMLIVAFSPLLQKQCANNNALKLLLPRQHATLPPQRLKPCQRATADTPATLQRRCSATNAPTLPLMPQQHNDPRTLPGGRVVMRGKGPVLPLAVHTGDLPNIALAGRGHRKCTNLPVVVCIIIPLSLNVQQIACRCTHGDFSPIAALPIQK